MSRGGVDAISSARLAEIFVEVADSLIDEFDLLEFLQMLTARAVSLVDAAAVGLLLFDERDKLQLVAGSNETVRLVELFQLQSQEGPCLEAFRTGRPVVNVNLQSATPRWPRFAPQAAAAGFRSVHAFPLRLRKQLIGALNVFGDAESGQLHDADVPIMQALADVATIALLQERSIRHRELLAEQLQGALQSRVAIEQAKGIIAQRRGITVDAAFTAIRTHARRHNLVLKTFADQIVADPASLPIDPVR